MQLNLTFQGRPHTVYVSDACTLGQLKKEIQTVTGIVPDLQKLLPGRGKAKPAALGPAGDADATLASLGLVDGQKVMVLGTTFAQLDQLNAQEVAATAQRHRRPHPKMMTTPKARNTTQARLPPFASVQARSDAPNSPPEVTAKVQAFLERMAADEAVLHVMELHGLAVGLLTELLPHEHAPSLRGLNEMAGQRISIRVRIDEEPHMLRDYRTCRQVLLHELAHNNFQGHPPDFLEFNSQLNRQVNDYEYAQRAGAHTLTTARVYTLSSDAEPDVDERRARLAAAAESRRAALELEIEHGETQRDDRSAPGPP